MLPCVRRLKTTIGQLVVHAQGDGRGVHHLEPPVEHLQVAERVELRGPGSVTGSAE